MTLTYYIIATILSVVAFIVSCFLTVCFIMMKKDGEPEEELRDCARWTMAAYSATVLSWAWPVAIPLAILGGMMYVARTAFKRL